MSIGEIVGYDNWKLQIPKENPLNKLVIGSKIEFSYYEDSRNKVYKVGVIEALLGIHSFILNSNGKLETLEWENVDLDFIREI